VKRGSARIRPDAHISGSSPAPQHLRAVGKALDVFVEALVISSHIRIPYMAAFVTPYHATAGIALSRAA
jgi:hypothetical protein